MVERKEYLEQLIGWKEEQVIKVVTGIRRCGKGVAPGKRRAGCADCIREL